ncbi:hypothetical protein WR25_17017 [Diploscapter pachys]|uniref:Uncharacterized protein n=1 Tax=Diploscapter pachys TaxID=2018661 RepID=A0A2A2KEL6_9BILA|nr:hypothetical protein WR25_17017 [Diploscapter pachys]
MAQSRTQWVTRAQLMALSPSDGRPAYSKAAVGKIVGRFESETVGRGSELCRVLMEGRDSEVVKLSNVRVETPVSTTTFRHLPAVVLERVLCLTDRTEITVIEEGTSMLSWPPASLNRPISYPPFYVTVENLSPNMTNIVVRGRVKSTPELIRMSSPRKEGQMVESLCLSLCDDSMRTCFVFILYSDSEDVADYMQIEVNSEVVVAFAETIKHGDHVAIRAYNLEQVIELSEEEFKLLPFDDSREYLFVEFPQEVIPPKRRKSVFIN